MSQWVKNPPTIQETQETPVRFLGQADPLEKSMTTHSNILAWRIQWTEEPGGLLSMGHIELDMTEGDRYKYHTCFKMLLKDSI